MFEIFSFYNIDNHFQILFTLVQYYFIFTFVGICGQNFGLKDHLFIDYVIPPKKNDVICKPIHNCYQYFMLWYQWLDVIEYILDINLTVLKCSKKNRFHWMLIFRYSLQGYYCLCRNEIETSFWIAIGSQSFLFFCCCEICIQTWLLMFMFFGRDFEFHILFPFFTHEGLCFSFLCLHFLVLLFKLCFVLCLWYSCVFIFGFAEIQDSKHERYYIYLYARSILLQSQCRTAYE